MTSDDYQFLSNVIKMQPLDPNEPMRAVATYRCMLCNNLVKLSGKYLKNRYKTYSSVGCKECNRNANRKVFVESIHEKLKDKFIILSDILNDTKNVHKDKITVTSKVCGHTFSTVVEYLTHRNVKCPICESERRKTARLLYKDGTVVKKDVQYSIERVKLLLESTDYRCIDYSEYNGIMSKIPFECKKGHVWKTVARFVVLQMVGCPQCAIRNYSKKSIEWLKNIEQHANIKIQHAENGGEKLITTPDGKRYYVDGFCESNNTVYEFHGSKYHGDPSVFEPEDTPHPYDKKTTSSELYEKTIIKQNDLIKMGYNVVVMWESEYDKLVKINK